MRKKTAGLVLAAAGAVLILSALLLLFHNRQEDRQAGERSQAVLEELRRVATDDATLPVGSLVATEGPELLRLLRRLLMRLPKSRKKSIFPMFRSSLCSRIRWILTPSPRAISVP